MKNKKLIIDVIDNTIRNNYYPISYQDKWKELVTDKFLLIDEKNMVHIRKEVLDKFENDLLKIGYTRYQLLAIKENGLHPVYFKNEMLAQYINNPNYHFHWDHYRGYISSIENGVDNVYLAQIFLGHDLKSKTPLTVMFVRDILEMDVNFQRYVERFEIRNTKNLRVSKEVVKNLIHGIRSEIKNIEIYNIILIGMKICNQIFEEKFKDKLFENIYEQKKYEFFRPIFISSKINYYLFVMELYKIIYDNIKIKTLKKEIISKNPKITLKELNDDKKWSKFKLFEETLGKENKNYLKMLSDVRNLPAHDIYENKLDNKYWKKQDEMLIETYKFLSAVIDKFLTKDIKTDFKVYSDIYGPHGSVSYSNGFNRSPYEYYDGDTRYICDVFQTRDIEYLIAFKSNENHFKALSNHIKNIRKDLNHEHVDLIVKRLLDKELRKANKESIESFFKGQYYFKEIYAPNKYKKDEYISLGEKESKEFLKKYALSNIYIIADRKDQNYNSLEDFKQEDYLAGKGYVTELIHHFEDNYKYNNVTTNPKKDLDVQVLSNRW